MPGGTRIESWRARCRMGECCAGLPRGRLGGSLQCPLLTWRFCLGRMDGLKMILLNLWLLFGFNVPRGAAEAKRRKDIYGEPPLLGIPRRYVVSIAARLSVWNTEELSPLNRDSSLCVCIFAFCILFARALVSSLCSFALVPEGLFPRLLLAVFLL